MKKTLALFALFPLFAFAASKPAAPAVAPIDVTVSAVKTADVPITIQGLGTLSAPQFVTLSSEVAGRVSKIYFKNGQEAAKGMPVIQLDNASAEATYQSDVAQLKASTNAYQRAKLLLNEAVSQQELDAAQAKMDADKAAVKESQATLNQKEITAPFSGTLGKFKVNVGDYVSAGDSLVSIVNSKQLQVDYNVPQAQLTRLKQGQLVTITVSSYPKKKFYGTVSYIAPTVNSTTRAIAVQALVPNPKGLLSQGMFVHVLQQIGTLKNQVIVPANAVSADIRGSYVYVLSGNKVAKTYITIGQHVDANIVVTKGLNVKDKVVVAGQQKLADGTVVKATVATTAATAQPTSKKQPAATKGSAVKAKAAATKGA